MNGSSPCLSHNSDEWETPQAFFDLLDREFAFVLDAAAAPGNVKCEHAWIEASLENVMKSAEIRFIKGRLKFGNSKNSAPFSSCVVVFRPGREELPPVISSMAVDALPGNQVMA